MNAKEYFKLTIKVRGRQTEYFRTRDNEIKKQSITLEKKVDAEIVRVATLDPEIYECVRQDYPELIKDIDKTKQLQLTFDK